MNLLEWVEFFLLGVCLGFGGLAAYDVLVSTWHFEINRYTIRLLVISGVTGVLIGEVREEIPF